MTVTEEGPVQPGARATRTHAGVVAGLDDRRARDPAIAGAKAAALARAAAAGAAVLPGFVISTHADRGGDAPVIREAWEHLSEHGAVPLVVRSSSTVEDAAVSSLAGCFESVIDVRGWEAFGVAVARVRASAERAGSAPMAVLVQPLLEAVCGGVLFGADPVTGDARRLVVECVRGTPGDLVSGEATADRYVLGPTGRVRSRSPDALALDRRTRRALARLARQMRSLFGSAQDIEWALDRQGRLWLLQSRPITTSGDTADACGPTLGPGPVAETFPDPLRPLERDLFAEPLRRGSVAALHTIGATSPRALARSPVVAFVGNRVAVDLELLGWARGPRRLPSVLNPIPGARRLVTAWHVGRLRTSLPVDGARIVASIDRRLSAVPAFRELSDEELVAVVEAATEHLVVVHAHQILAGMLLPQEDDRPSSTSVALPALGAARRQGLDDGTIAAQAPVVLALVPPRIGTPAPLPDGEPIDGRFPPPVPALAPREALRLRARWLDELVARAGTELGRRLWRAGRLDDPDDVRELTFAELASIVGGGPVPRDLAARRVVADGPPLPATFRLTPTGTVVAVRAGSPAGRGAGGGRGEGTVVDAEGRTSCEGHVLVTRVLSPSLAASLPGLRGLVSETGSTLSHLAILAREHGVPTVVAVEDALARFPAGARVLVDGTTGEVRCLDDVPDVGGGR